MSLLSGSTSKHYGRTLTSTREEVLMCDFDGHKCKAPHGETKKEDKK